MKNDFIFNLKNVINIYIFNIYPANVIFKEK